MTIFRNPAVLLASALSVTGCIVPGPAYQQQPGYGASRGYDDQYNYTYYPSYGVYFDPLAALWYWSEGGNWLYGPSLPYYYPSRPSGGVTIVLDSRQPYTRHDYVVEHYGGPPANSHYGRGPGGGRPWHGPPGDGGNGHGPPGDDGNGHGHGPPGNGGNGNGHGPPGDRGNGHGPPGDGGNGHGPPSGNGRGPGGNGPPGHGGDRGPPPRHGRPHDRQNEPRDQGEERDRHYHDGNQD
jgi:hypothetical protein